MQLPSFFFMCHRNLQLEDAICVTVGSAGSRTNSSRALPVVGDKLHDCTLPVLEHTTGIVMKEVT